jgi:hypothetical protein
MFCLISGGVLFAQTQYRRPSDSDIEWLLGGNSRSKLPNRNSINTDNQTNLQTDSNEYQNSITQAGFHNNTDNYAGNHSNYGQRKNLPDPCQPVSCSKNGSKLKSPSCCCEYCDNRSKNIAHSNSDTDCSADQYVSIPVNPPASRDRSVPPCDKVKSSPSKFKPINPKSAPQRISYNDGNTAADEVDTETDVVTWTKTEPVTAVETFSEKFARSQNDENKTDKSTISFAAREPTPIESDTIHEQSNAPETAPENLIMPKTAAIALPTRHAAPHKIDPPQKNITPKKYQHQNEHNNTCNSSNNYCNDNSCSSCSGKKSVDKFHHGKSYDDCFIDDYQVSGCDSGEVIAETCVGFLFRQIARLRDARVRHNDFCGCWLCANLDNPDMVGNGVWGAWRVAGFSGRFRNGSQSQWADLQASPNLLLSRPDVANHFNAETRNRIWIDYRQFNNAVGNGRFLAWQNEFIEESRTLNLFTFGLEKRIGKLSSLEIRVPLIYQYDSGFDAGSLSFANRRNLTRGSEVEIGNILLTSKYIFARTKKYTLAAGIGTSLPTADDWKITGYDAAIKNKSYNIISFVGAQYHPNDSTFGHLLVQADIPVNGNELQLNDQKINIDESQIIRVGLQLGRWFYRNERGLYSCRIGGFVELDYAIAVNSADNGSLADNINNINYSNIFISSTKNKPDELNLAFGLPVMFGLLSINNALIIPISNDHQFSIAYNFSLSRRF